MKKTNRKFIFLGFFCILPFLIVVQDSNGFSDSTSLPNTKQEDSIVSDYSYDKGIPSGDGENEQKDEFIQTADESSKNEAPKQEEKILGRQKNLDYMLEFYTTLTDSVPEHGFGMWLHNYVTAHNPGVGESFIDLKIGDNVLVNNLSYVVAERKLIWGPKEVYKGTPAGKEYKDVNTGKGQKEWIFDGRMTFQTCADNGYSKVWIFKLIPYKK